MSGIADCGTESTFGIFYFNTTRPFPFIINCIEIELSAFFIIKYLLEFAFRENKVKTRVNNP